MTTPPSTLTRPAARAVPAHDVCARGPLVGRRPGRTW
jgi:hypothetical protein